MLQVPPPPKKKFTLDRLKFASALTYISLGASRHWGRSQPLPSPQPFDFPLNQWWIHGGGGDDGCSPKNRDATMGDKTYFWSACRSQADEK